jgi:1-phosphofructokinase/tagatose 6-phosphate kinase
MGGERAAWFRERVTADGIDLRDVESGSPIRTCVTAVDLGSRESTELVEEGAPVTAGTEARVLDLYAPLSPRRRVGGGVVVISGSKAPGFSADIFPEMTSSPRSLVLRVVLDVRMDDLRCRRPLRSLRIKVNEDEFRATYARGGESTPDAIARVRRETGALVAVTAGPRPSSLTAGTGLPSIPCRPSRR